MDFDPITTAVGVFAEHGDRAVQVAAIQASNCALEGDGSGFRHWTQVIAKLNAMIQVTPNPTLL